MFHRFCLLCLILSCRFVIGRLPKDSMPLRGYTVADNDGLIAATFSGVHSIQYVQGGYYVLSKNNVSSITIDVSDLGKAKLKIDQAISWDPLPNEVLDCKRKMTDPTACDNYIRIFASKTITGREFIVCGTHSSEPQCRTYIKQSNTFKRDLRKKDFSGTSICPFNPKQTGASLYEGGDLYTATFADLLGRKPGIYRRGVDNAHENLARPKKDETWLNDPWFVKFVATEPKVYIFFKETAVEDGSGLTYTRVGQICKKESGGDRILRRQFTSFVKARLNCSFPGDPPFYFNEIAAASDFYQTPGTNQQSILFAAMNTPKNSIWGSAVCAYIEQDIEQAMRGPFLERHSGDDGKHYWIEKNGDPEVTNLLSRCPYDKSGKSTLSVENLQFIRDHPFKSHSIPSWSKPGRRRVPLFMKLHAQYQFSAIAVDPDAGSTTLYLVLLLGTTDGKLLKVIPPLTDAMESAHFVEESDVYDQTQCDPTGERQVRDIKVDKISGYIIVAFSSCVVSVPMCPIAHTTCKRSCIAAQDPYCAWDKSKCSTVLRKNTWEQDVLGGNVEGLSLCPVDSIDDDDDPIGGGKTKTPTLGNGTKTVNSTAPMNTIMSAKNDNAAVSAGFHLSWESLCIGLAVGTVIILLLGLVLCRCRERALPSNKKIDRQEKVPMKASNHLNDSKRNSYSQKQDRPLSNHTQRHHSKRSDSSIEEDEAFIDDKSDGNSNSFDKKSRRKRESSTNRRSNTSSYRREDSNDQIQPNRHGVNRQTSRESNDSGLNGEQIDTTHPPSPPNAGMHRTMSATAAQPHRQSGRELKRQLSLQIPTNSHGQMMNFQHSLTPMAFMPSQMPFDHPMQHQYAVTPGPMQAPHFDASGPAQWHQSPAKNAKSMSGQHQTTSLDRKMIRAGLYRAGVPHDVQQQQQPRGYADTLPPHGMDDPRAQGRKRYPSESVASNHRPYVAKPPPYQSIEEEVTPVPDSPTKFPPNIHQRTTGRMRPTQLPLNENFVQFQPANSTTTPLMEQAPPSFMISPSHPAGHTLPTKQFRRINSDIPVTYSNQPHHDLPHPQSTPNFYKDYRSKSNPTTPDVDPNHNSFFRDQIDPSQARKRHPSGKSNTPTSKEFPDRPDVIPAATQPVETTHLEIRQNDQTV